jgi:myo-inositol-1-phosphate synthase
MCHFLGRQERYVTFMLKAETSEISQLTDLRVKLEVEDAPNSAGVVIDVIRATLKSP